MTPTGRPARIAIFGGTGYAGGAIAAEAQGRGHKVTSYTRSGSRGPQDGVRYERGSLSDPVTVVAAARDHDLVVVAVHAVTEGEPDLPEVMPAVIEACLSQNARLGVVGGAGSSLIEGGGRLVDTPEFHEEWKSEALTHARVLDDLRESDDALDWFYVSPAALFGSYAPGETTGSYRTGGDDLVVKPDGSSEISGTDFALAFVDEIEQPQHQRQRFTVGH